MKSGLTRIAKFALVIAVILPGHTSGKQAIMAVPQKRYLYDSTWRPRVYEYCALKVGVAMKPSQIIPTKSLVSLNNCVLKIINNN